MLCLKRYLVPLMSRNLRRNLSLALSGGDGVVLGGGQASCLDWDDIDKVRRDFPPGESDMHGHACTLTARN